MKGGPSYAPPVKTGKSKSYWIKVNALLVAGAGRAF